MKAIVSITIAAIAFSFYPLLNSIALQSVSPFFLALLVQFATIGTGICALFCVNRSVANILQYFKDYILLPFNTILIPIFSGIGIYLGGLFFLFALSLMSKAGASLIMESWPILAVFLAPMILNKNWSRLSIGDIGLMILSLIGLLFITVSEERITFSEFLKNPLFVFNMQDMQGYIGILLAFLSAFCFATASIARSYFASALPQDFRIKHFKKTETVEESIFTYLLTYLCGLPLAVVSFIFMEEPVHFQSDAIGPILCIGISLVITSSLYSYSMLVTDNANINFIWYISPLLAAIWLILFGYSQVTLMLVAGGACIIVANLILIVLSIQRHRKKESFS